MQQFMSATLLAALPSARREAILGRQTSVAVIFNWV